MKTIQNGSYAPRTRPLSQTLSRMFPSFRMGVWSGIFDTSSTVSRTRVSCHTESPSSHHGFGLGTEFVSQPPSPRWIPKTTRHFLPGYRPGARENTRVVCVETQSQMVSPRPKGSRTRFGLKSQEGKIEQGREGVEGVLLLLRLCPD